MVPRAQATWDETKAELKAWVEPMGCAGAAHAHVNIPLFLFAILALFAFAERRTGIFA